MRFSKTSNVNSFSNFSLPAFPMVLRKFAIARFWAKISATSLSPHIATSQTLCDHISTIAVRILQSLLHLSEVELMNAHMINQILPMLLLESTRQGIAKHNAMEAVLTRHLLHIPRFLLIQDMTIPPNQDPVHFHGHHRISSLQGLFPSRKQHIEDQDSSCIHFKSLLYSHSYNSIFGFVSQK